MLTCIVAKFRLRSCCCSARARLAAVWSETNDGFGARLAAVWSETMTMGSNDARYKLCQRPCYYCCSAHDISRALNTEPSACSCSTTVRVYLSHATLSSQLYFCTAVFNRCRPLSLSHCFRYRLGMFSPVLTHILAVTCS